MRSKAFDPLKGTPFSVFRQKAEKALKEGRVIPIAFSHATYQLKVGDPLLSEPVWTFLQFQQTGGIEDAFCSCDEGDAVGGCWHLAASLLKIYSAHAIPLHLRFEKSRWHKLGVRLWAEIEGASKEPELKDDTLTFFDREDHKIFKVSGPELKEIFSNGEAETEETSIKFSNLSEEELELWRKGLPPPSLLFELSPLSDLMKWCFLQEEEGNDPQTLLKFKFPEGISLLDKKEESVSFYRYNEGKLTDGETIWFGEELSHFLEHKLREGSLGELDLPFEREKVDVLYRLSWENEEALAIEMFLEHPGDIEVHGTWAHHHERGFIPLKEPQFHAAFVKIPRQEIADFVQKNRVWLNLQPGFFTHLARRESRLGYEITKEGDLLFTSHDPAEEEGWIDCGGWLYLEGEGFFPREGPMGKNHPFAGRLVPNEKIETFITENFDVLLQVGGFFSSKSPLRQFGLKVSLEENRLIIEPAFSFHDEVKKEEIQLFGPYLYWEKKGFSTFSVDPRIPSDYLSKKEIEKAHWEEFFIHVYPLLLPYVVESSKELVPIKSPTLQLKTFAKVPGGWIRGELALEGLDLLSLKEKKERFLLTPAGLLDQQDFSWLQEVEKEMPPWKWLKIFLLLTPKTDELSPKGKKLLDKLCSLKVGKLPPLNGFLAKLRIYQEVGLKWLYHLYERGFSGLLADDMGLGKTLQAMALVAALVTKKKKFRCLIICPTSVMYHWKEKLGSFLPTASFSLFHGIKRELDPIKKRTVPLLITSYGVAKRDIAKLKKIPFDLIIFDEIQMAKNHTSRLWEALTLLKGGMLVGLSGTPIENRLRELKALFDLLLPGYFPSEQRFKEEFILPIERENSPDKKELLQRITRPFILRRTKGEVLQELPEKIEEVAHCEMTPEQQDLYLKVLEEGRQPLLKAIKEDKPIAYVHVFALLHKLKEITNHPSLYLKSPDILPDTSSGKWNLYQELLEEALGSGQKVVVFSQSLLMLDYFAKDLDSKGIGWSSIRGSTHDREGALKKFKEEDCKVFLASLKAGGVGIDLTEASVVIHYDRWWNPAKEDQATDRVHRMGQQRGVQVFKLMTLNSIEERIDEILRQKGRLKEGLFREMKEDELPELSKKDLLFLLG